MKLSTGCSAPGGTPAAAAAVGDVSPLFPGPGTG